MRNHRTETAGFVETGSDPRCLRRCCAQLAKVGYLIPARAANFTPLKPLRSNSSSKLSRRAAGVFTRPKPSVFNNTTSPASIIDVIALRYDSYEPVELALRVTLTLKLRETRKQLASELGVSIITLWGWETNRWQPTTASSKIGRLLP